MLTFGATGRKTELGCVKQRKDILWRQDRRFRFDRMAFL